jgi:hypothetical protein
MTLEKSLKDLLFDESNGCGKEFTQLRVVLELLKLKANHGWSDNSFSELFNILEKYFESQTHCPQVLTERRSLYVHCP